MSFLDAMTCGLGAVILLYMIINAAVTREKNDVSQDLKAEVDRLEAQILEEQEYLVEARNTVNEITKDQVITQGLSRRLIEVLSESQEELATMEKTTLAKKEHVNKLAADLKSLEEDAKRLSAQTPSEEVPGDKVRAIIGDGDRQYLTGLKLGGRRTVILLDTSASMLDRTIVSIIRLRNLREDRRVKAPKWRRTLATVDWLTAQIPAESFFQIITFNEKSRQLNPKSDTWLPGQDADVLEEVNQSLAELVPRGGTSLHNAFDAVAAMSPRPDNLIIITDGLPTQGNTPPPKGTISAKKRLKLFVQASKKIPRGMPVNVILMPMEGDPMATSAFWKLAVSSRGSFMSPPKDWP